MATQAARAMQRGDYGSAEAVYRRLIPQAPEMAELHSNLGLACLLQSKAPCATKAFEKALSLNEELFLPNYSLGQLLFQQERYADALAYVDRAVRLEPGQIEARELLIATLVGLAEYRRAIDEYGIVLKSAPQNQDAHYGLGGIYMRLSQGETDRLGEDSDSGYRVLIAAERDAPDQQWRALVLNTYQDAFAEGVRLPGARIAYALLQLADDQRQAARATLEEELRIDPFSYEARFHLARLALLDGDCASSARFLNEAVAIRPEFFVPLPSLEQIDAHIDAGELNDLLQADEPTFGAAYLLGRLNAAKVPGARRDGYLRIAEELRDAALASHRAARPADVSSAVGLELLRSKRYEQGLKILLPRLREADGTSEAVREIARSLARLGRHQELIDLYRNRSPEAPEEIYLLATSLKQVALSHFEQLVRLDPESPRAHQVLGDSYVAQHRLDDALAEYVRASEIAPGDAGLPFRIASLLHRMMEFGRSADAFAELVELDPLHADAHIHLGEALVQLGKTDEGIRSLRRGLDLNPQSPQAHVALGKAYRLAGDDEEALRHLIRGASADQDGKLHYQLFLLYRGLGKPDEARAALETSQRLRSRSQ
ncbi:MAG: tetratricopeptide repeat protein [Bryobacterales bacterium]|nr:tetratricopeptide repeat protein [Bryobacterales bacterium]